MPAFEAENESHGRYTLNGFKMTFDNGYTVSVQFGTMNYSDLGETTAEVAVWDNNQPGAPFVHLGGLTPTHDQVAARVTAGGVAEALSRVSRLPAGELMVSNPWQNEEE